MIFINGMVLRLKKLAARSGSSAALHRFIGHILLSVLSGNSPAYALGVWVALLKQPALPGEAPQTKNSKK
jgi:hypothetical protein